ncbi:hypothetical protein RHO12_12780 (plasmid) [Orbus sturtevantii]|uniref:hypothetical protein n=1 Tax=Orbus sturtevantii TaxID=3074109 RepID=UPI00370D5AEE
MTKKRNKKYNPTLKFQIISKERSKYYKILDITAIGVFVYRRNREYKPKKADAHLLNGVRYKWQIMAGVICRDQFKKEYLKTETFITAQEYFTSELADYLTEFQKELWEQSNPLHRLTQFWLASPVETDINDNWLLSQLTNKGAYSNFITEYEHAQMNKVSLTTYKATKD